MVLAGPVQGLTRCRLLLATCTALLTVACVSLITAAPAAAATLKVTSFTDTTSACSLREAITAVNNPGTSTPCGTADATSNIIALSTGTYTLSIPPSGGDDNSTGDLNVTASAPLSIVGAGPSSTTIAGLSSLKDRLVNVSSASQVQLVGLTLTGGHAPDGTAGTTPGVCLVGGDGGSGSNGGAIDNAGTLALNVVTVAGNRAGAGGTGGGQGGVFGNDGCSGGPGGNGGGIYNDSTGTLTIDNSMIVNDNQAGAGGAGGAGNSGSAGTGGGGGGGGAGGGIYNNSGQLIVLDSLIAGNSAGSGGNGGVGGGSGGNGGGGGDAGWGGGSYSTGGSASVINDTFAGDTAGSGGKGGMGAGGGNGGNGGAGGDGGAVATSNAPTRLLNATVASNGIGAGGAGGTGASGGTGGANGSGGGVYVTSSGSANNLKLQNTIMAGNTTTNCAPSANITDGGHNLSTDATCPAAIYANPELMSLSNYGGYSGTLALQPSSPAINQVPASGANCPSTDQRGVSRPQGSACDIGAFEFAVPTIKITAPRKGAHYKKASRIKAAYTCTEGGITNPQITPISTCSGTVAVGSRIDTSSLGPKTFTVTSTDKQGNTTTKTVHYTVVRK